MKPTASNPAALHDGGTRANGRFWRFLPVAPLRAFRRIAAVAEQLSIAGSPPDAGIPREPGKKMQRE